MIAKGVARRATMAAVPRLIPVLALALTVAGCREAPTQLVVVVSTDNLAVPDEVLVLAVQGPTQVSEGPPRVPRVAAREGVEHG